MSAFDVRENLEEIRPPDRPRRPGTRQGLAMATVMVATVIGLGLWAISYRQLSSQMAFEERMIQGTVDGVPPDYGAAFAAYLRCFRLSSNPLPTTGCKVKLGAGSNQRIYFVSYTAGPATPDPQYTITVVPWVAQAGDFCDCGGSN